MGNWADLPIDLLVTIARLIDEYRDYVCFGAACKSWYSVASPIENFHGPEPTRWLMLAEKDEEDEGSTRCFLGLTKGLTTAAKATKVYLPEARRRRCFESLGWFVTISRDGDVNLLHPFSRKQIILPNLSTMEDFDLNMPEYEVYTIRKAILTASPSENEDYTVVVINGPYNYLSLWRPGDPNWTRLPSATAAYLDIVYYNDLLYAVDIHKKVFSGDIRGSSPTLMTPVGEIADIKEYYDSHLVVVPSAGEILIVIREGSELRFDEDYKHVRNLNIVFDESRIDYGTLWFRVFAINLSNSDVEERYSLGNQALFFGHSGSVSVDATRLPGVKANCIYYTDDCWPTYSEFKRGGGKDMGIYHLEDGTIEKLFDGESFSPVCPPIWVTPT